MSVILLKPSVRSISANILKFQSSVSKILNDGSCLKNATNGVPTTSLLFLNTREYHNFTYTNVNREKNSNVEKLLKATDYFCVPSASLSSKKKLKKMKHTKAEGIKEIPSFRGIEIPETPKLPYMLKVPPPQYAGQRPMKMKKELHYIRGEEEVHTDFIHGQYGIVADLGGFMKYGHFEMIRLEINRRINTKKCFAIWRVDQPWKSHTKKGVGKRMGMGKGSISYYTTPVKAKRVIIEVGGKCTFEEVSRMLDIIAHKLPFPASAMTQEMIENKRREEERLIKENLNEFTFKYIVQNNMLGSQMWAKKKMDFQYFGKCD